MSRYTSIHRGYRTPSPHFGRYRISSEDCSIVPSNPANSETPKTTAPSSVTASSRGRGRSSLFSENPTENTPLSSSPDYDPFQSSPSVITVSSDGPESQSEDRDDDPDPPPSPSPLTEISPNRRPRRRRNKELSRDDRVGLQRCQRWLGAGPTLLAARTDFTKRQIQYALTHPVTPQKAKPRPYARRLNDQQRHNLNVFLNADPSHRNIAWADLRVFVPGFWDVGIDAISTAMLDLGYYRGVDRLRIKTNKEIRDLRLEMCQYFLNKWSDPQDWLDGVIAFSDEAFFNNVNRGIRHVTIHQLEDPASFVRLHHRGEGIMFWGIVCGRWKGPCFIFPTDWTVNSDTYEDFVLPRVQGFVEQLRDLRPDLNIHFMHDGSAIHTSYQTTDNLDGISFPVVPWASHSPDLNPIENLWAYMKLWIDDRYVTEDLTRQELIRVVKEAWEAIPEEELEKLALGMPNRLQTCIDNQGYPINY